MEGEICQRYFVVNYGNPGPDVVLSNKTLDTIMKRVRFIVDENALVSELRKARYVVKYSLLGESGVRALYKTIEKALATTA